MAVLVFLGVLVATSLAAPFLGADRSDARAIDARPRNGWYPGA
jgi:hypothetical protein